MLSKETKKAMKSMKRFSESSQDMTAVTASEMKLVLDYIEYLENKVKQLGKGQHTLMQSRRKWKRRYYKEKQRKEKLKKPHLQELCQECSTITKKVGFTKADTDRIIKETREMTEKANKYDSLVKKIKDRISEIKENKIDLKLEQEYKEYDYEIELMILQELLNEQSVLKEEAEDE